MTNPLTAIKCKYSTACVRTSLSMKSLTDGTVFWEGFAMYLYSYTVS